MQRLIPLALFISLLSFSAMAGEGTEPNDTKETEQVHGPRPDLPGALLVNVGSSFFVNAPSAFKTKVFESRPFDIYYTRSFDMPNLKLSFVPGLGFGFDRYGFKKAVKLDYTTPGDKSTLVLDSISNTSIKPLHSKLITNYIDMPLELRFIPKIANKEKSIFIAVGGSVGYLFEAHTKFEYKEGSQKKTTKQREDWNLNKIRYGVHARIGMGGFSIYYKMGLNNVFKKGEGPNGYNFTASTIGISFNGF